MQQVSLRYPSQFKPHVEIVACLALFRPIYIRMNSTGETYDNLDQLTYSKARWYQNGLYNPVELNLIKTLTNGFLQ